MFLTLLRCDYRAVFTRHGTVVRVATLYDFGEKMKKKFVTVTSFRQVTERKIGIQDDDTVIYP
jgi:hypothetical protein